MTKWEYLHVEFTVTEDKHLQDHLNVYGDEGWEVLFLMIVEWKKESKEATPTSKAFVERSAIKWAVVFKRPKGAE